VPTKRKREDVAAANRSKAMSHPLRAKVLLLLAEAPGSPAEIVDRLEADGEVWERRKDLTSEVSHQINYLVRLKCAEVADKRETGRFVQSIYRATEAHLIKTEDWEALPASAKDHNRIQFAQTHVDNLVAWLGNGGGLNKYFHVASDRYWLDQEGLERFMEITEEARLELEKEAAAAARRIGKSKDEALRVASMLGCIEVPPLG